MIVYLLYLKSDKRFLKKIQRDLTKLTNKNESFKRKTSNKYLVCNNRLKDKIKYSVPTLRYI